MTAESEIIGLFTFFPGKIVLEEEKKIALK